MFGDEQASNAPPNEAGVTICYSTQLNEFCVVIGHNVNFYSQTLDELKSNKLYFTCIKLNKKHFIGNINGGSLVTESTIKIPTCAKNIQFLSRIRGNMAGGYEIGNNYMNKSYLRNPEIVDSMLKILLNESNDKSRQISKLQNVNKHLRNRARKFKKTQRKKYKVSKCIKTDNKKKKTKYK